MPDSTDLPVNPSNPVLGTPEPAAPEAAAPADAANAAGSGAGQPADGAGQPADGAAGTDWAAATDTEGHAEPDTEADGAAGADSAECSADATLATPDAPDAPDAPEAPEASGTSDASGTSGAPALPQLNPAACAELLRQHFPALFAGPAKPFKLRIQQDIQARAPGAFSKGSLSAYFRRHTGSTGYLIALSKASHRFDLDGQPAGELSEEHKQLAQAELIRRRQLTREREQLAHAQQRDQQREAQRVQMAEQAEAMQARQTRAALLRDFQRTTLTLANFCALKGMAPELLNPLLEQARKEASEAPPMPVGGFDDRRGPGPRRDDRPGARPGDRATGRPDNRADPRGGPAAPGGGRPDARGPRRDDRRPPRSGGAPGGRGPGGQNGPSGSSGPSGRSGPSGKGGPSGEGGPGGSA